MSTFFTADLNLGYDHILELSARPFSSVTDMNEAIVRRWNMTVGPEDMVFILGNLAMGKLDDSLTYVAHLNGSKVLIPGNHDRVWGGYPPVGKPIKDTDIDRYEDAGVTIMGDGTSMMFYRDNGDAWTLCHFPDVGDSGDNEQRFDAWRPVLPQNPGVLIHGHVHEQWVVNGPRINVGMDVWNFTPASESEVAKLAEVSWGVKSIQRGAQHWQERG